LKLIESHINRLSLIRGESALLIISLLVIFLVPGCEGRYNILDPSPKPDVHRDLEEIKQEGILKAILVYSSTSYFIYRGRAMGYEYELLNQFARSQNLRLEIVVAHNIDELLEMLNRGDGDLIAYGMTITQDREKKVDFTHHLYLTNQVLVQRKPEKWMQMKQADLERKLVTSPLQLLNDTVTVRRNSSYYERLINLQSEIGGKIHIDTTPGNWSTERIIELVSEGSLKYTLADKNIAELLSTFHKNLDVSTPMSLSQRVAWAVRENSPELQPQRRKNQRV
jgi:membrane-bound lytic murein transglycosylase F